MIERTPHSPKKLERAHDEIEVLDAGAVTLVHQVQEVVAVVLGCVFSRSSNTPFVMVLFFRDLDRLTIVPDGIQKIQKYSQNIFVC